MIARLFQLKVCKYSQYPRRSFRTVIDQSFFLTLRPISSTLYYNITLHKTAQQISSLTVLRYGREYSPRQLSLLPLKISKPDRIAQSTDPKTSKSEVVAQSRAPQSIIIHWYNHSRWKLDMFVHQSARAVKSLQNLESQTINSRTI